MNLDKGVFRLWIVVTPLIWITIFYFNFYEISNNPFKLVGYCSKTEDNCLHKFGDKQVITRSFCMNSSLTIEIECQEDIWLSDWIGGPLRDDSKVLNENFDNYGKCENFFSKAERTTIEKPIPNNEIKRCEQERKEKRNSIVIYLFLLFIAPLTLYPIYLAISRIFIWIKNGFK